MPSESVELFLRAPGRNVRVADGQDVTIDPEARDWADAAFRLEISGFDDLRALRLVPERLDEQPAREAVASDDAAARELARRLAENGEGGGDACCAPCASRQDGSYPVRVRALYRQIRPTAHTALARAVGNALGVWVEADSPQARIAHSWTVRYSPQVSRIPVWALKLRDIEIGKNATMTLAQKAKSLWANDIRIHTGGRLVVTSGYVKIRANSVRGNLA